MVSLYQGAGSVGVHCSTIVSLLCIKSLELECVYCTSCLILPGRFIDKTKLSYNNTEPSLNNLGGS